MNKINKAYSIAEALVTLLIVALIFIVLAPSISGKKPRYKQFFKSQHGMFYCDKEDGNCEFKLPDGVKDAYIIAIGAGGGGAGSSCSSENRTFNYNLNKLDEDTVFSYVFIPKSALYVSAFAAGGGSVQGECDRYPLEFDREIHDTRCKIFDNPNKTITTWGPKKVQVQKMVNGELKWVDVSPVRYEYAQLSTNTTPLGITCDMNTDKYGKTKADSRCFNSQKSTYFPELSGTYKSYQYEIALGTSKEASMTSRADVCEVDWIHKPDVGEPKRHCNSKIFGGRGGYGQGINNKRICPNLPDSPTCIKKVEAHDTPVGCKPEDIAKGYSWEKNQMCGHPCGAYNCCKPHNREYIEEKCLEYAKQDTDIPLSIGKPGAAGGGNANPIIVGKYFTVNGGNGGARGSHGATAAGSAGGAHAGMSQEYSAFDFINNMPVNNYQRGKEGHAAIKKYYINVGSAGLAGEFQAGYFRNIKGTIKMKRGKKGKGGKDGAAGENGGDTSVRADESIFNKDENLLFSKGGKGGTVERHYEACNQNIDDEELSENKYENPKGQKTREKFFGGGGDGRGGTVPGCETTTGSDGQNGTVIIFY